MQLPQALEPWSEWLGWFAPELLPGFADLLGRINPVLGPLRGRQQNGVPEPDGLGDLQRRGPYERLLSSEWLLAEEVPDEFLRRAAGGEHLFVAPQYRAHQANALIVVLFDAGPLQLGASRLVHVALLILLARRAREAGAQFRWGILQATPRLYELDSVAQIKRLLDQRVFACVSAAHWQAWSEWLGQQELAAGECWAVGQRLPIDANDPLCSHRVQVQRDLDGSALSFEVLGSGRARLQLPMPDNAAAMGLLRGEFDSVQAAPVRHDEAAPRVALTLPPVISSAGNYVALALLGQPGAVVIKLPTEQQKKKVEIRRHLWAAGRSPLSMAFLSRTFGAVLSDEQQLVFWKMSGLVNVPRPGIEQLKIPPGTASLLPTAWLRSRDAGRLYLLDTQGHLAFWTMRVYPLRADQELGKTHFLADRVLGMAKVEHETLVYVRNERGQLQAHTAGVNGGGLDRFVVGAAEGVSQVLIAAGFAWRHGFGACALLTVNNGSESWRLLTPASYPAPHEQISLAPGWRGLGLVRKDESCSMLLMGPDQQTFALYFEGRQEVLFSTSHPVVKSSFCPISGLLAVLTGARELLVYSVRQRKMRLQLFCNLAPEKDAAHA